MQGVDIFVDGAELKMSDGSRFPRPLRVRGWARGHEYLDFSTKNPDESFLKMHFCG